MRGGRSEPQGWREDGWMVGGPTQGIDKMVIQRMQLCMAGVVDQRQYMYIYIIYCYVCITRPTLAATRKTISFYPQTYQIYPIKLKSVGAGGGKDFAAGLHKARAAGRIDFLFHLNPNCIVL